MEARAATLNSVNVPWDTLDAIIYGFDIDIEDKGFIEAWVAQKSSA